MRTIAQTGKPGPTSTRVGFGFATWKRGDCLHKMGRTSEARELFERLLALRNDLGLLSEEYDPRAQRQLGNFPQAFTHVALVNTARLLNEGQPKHT